MRNVRWLVAVAAVAVIAGTAAFAAFEREPPASRTLVGAGDIADSDSPASEEVAELLDGIEGTVFTLGDNVQGNGAAEEFEEYYDPTWGRHKDRTRPAVGNHEYYTPGASGYFDYFGEAAGDPEKGYYSYDIGEWHIVVLNSMCEEVGGCSADSPEARWLKANLEDNPAKCTLAMGHHPLFSSSDKHGSDEKMKPTYEILHEAGVEAVLSGSEGNYERFAPQDAEGNADPEGVRQFIVGTGGHFLNGFDEPLPNSEVRNGETHGVLELTLNPDGYDWEFVPVEGDEFTDSGSAECHE
ncbi:hypothetical protein BH20ACT10_BH20ACT10_24770 [soil metagenome]